MTRRTEQQYREQYDYEDDEEIDEDDFVVWCGTGFSPMNDQE